MANISLENMKIMKDLYHSVRKNLDLTGKKMVDTNQTPSSKSRSHEIIKHY
jgi:hypothetical protein